MAGFSFRIGPVRTFVGSRSAEDNQYGSLQLGVTTYQPQDNDSESCRPAAPNAQPNRGWYSSGPIGTSWTQPQRRQRYRQQNRTHRLTGSAAPLHGYWYGRGGFWQQHRGLLHSAPNSASKHGAAAAANAATIIQLAVALHFGRRIAQPSQLVQHAHPSGEGGGAIVAKTDKGRRRGGQRKAAKAVDNGSKFVAQMQVDDDAVVAERHSQAQA